MKRKKLNLLLAVLLISAIAMLFVSCGKDTYVPNGEIYDTLPPYDEYEGRDTCSHRIKEVFVRTDTSETIKACTLCGYNSDGYHYYHTYDMIDGSVLGKYEKILIKLNADYNDKTLNIRSDVSELILIGNEGQTLDGLQINVEARRSELTISLSDVNVISNKTVIDAGNCDKDITIKTYGTSNSLTTRNGKAGEDGELVTVTKNYTYQYYANSGTDGENAADVIRTGASISLCAYSPLDVKAGDGGKGGNGASHKSGSIGFGIANGGGNGGHGGKGGSAVVYSGNLLIIEGEDKITLTSGIGGKGGSGGKKYSGSGSLVYNYSDGTDGYNGADGN
ncbi:MAG: hypothetical protein E7617_00340 [Ruminococcaceae bacterium]|nr:hypothetical protein [Oscillospiraceae bacterium]